MKIRVALAVLAACAAMTSCGSDDKEEAGSNPSPSATATEAPDTCTAATAVEKDLAALKAAATSGDADLGYSSSVALVDSLTAFKETDLPAKMQSSVDDLLIPLQKSIAGGELDLQIMGANGDQMTKGGNAISAYIVSECA